MPSKSPCRWERWLADNRVVLLENLFRTSLHENVDLKLSTSRNETEVGLISLAVFDNWRHSIRISEIETKELTLIYRLHKHERMNTVGLLASRSVIFIWLLTVCPHCPGALPQLKVGISFSKTINSSRWKKHVHLQVSIHKDKRRILSGENVFSCTVISKLETKRLVEYF